MRFSKKAKHIISIILLLFCGIVFLSACSNDLSINEKIVYKGAEYERLVLSSWIPFGELNIKPDEGMQYWNNDAQAVEVNTYNGDDENLFIFSGATHWFDEGHVYYKKTVSFPSYRNNSNVEKISVVIDEKEHILSQSAKEALLNLFESIEKGENLPVTERKNGSAAGLIRIYYYGFPAYEEEWMLDYSGAGKVGISYCETRKNKKYFGDYDSIVELEGILKSGVQAFL